jgi:tetratricopeptide (TPR) repeat protein
MDIHLSKKLEQVVKLARSDRYDDARSLCDELIAQYQSDSEPYAKLAYVNAREGRYPDAVTCISQAIERSPGEPEYFYSRGRYHLAIGQTEDALRDFEEVIHLEGRHQSSYYLEPAWFYKAESLARIGNFDEALRALESVSNGFSAWDGGLITKGEVEQRCLSALGKASGAKPVG